MNDNDSEKIRGMLQAAGFSVDASREHATGFNREPPYPDLVVINTCCVRENAEQRFWGVLGSYKWLRELNPGGVVAVCGCMTHERGAAQRIQETFPYVDILFGTQNLQDFPALLLQAYARIDATPAAISSTSELPFGGPFVSIAGERERNVAEGIPMQRGDPPCAFVSAMFGCDNFCAYCIVPYVRGRERSREPQEILREVQDLAAGGYKEVTLLGQNVNSYGKGLPTATSFADLLERVAAVPGIERVRFMTSHPKDLSDRLIDAMAGNPVICPHIHLPVQSGSTRVLARMNRGYTKEGYLALARKIREAIPGVSITTDIIVGFPGETEEDFIDTLDVVSAVAFDAAFTFLYSPREGTPAAALPDPVPDAVAKERFSRLLALQNAASLRANQRLLGATVPVLCEGRSKTNPQRFTGKTPCARLVNFSCPPHRPAIAAGETVPVRIASAGTWTLDGETVPHTG